MSDYWFFTSLVAGALWSIGRTIREAAWTMTPEAAEEHKQAAAHARFVGGLKHGKRNARREKWGARLAWMNTVAAAFPDWMFKETRSDGRALYCAFPASPFLSAFFMPSHEDG